MSIECLCVIPQNPKYVPAEDSRSVALAALRDMLPAAESVEVFVHKDVRFIDSGTRFERVSCPLCKSELDQIWWGDAMNAAHKADFEDLRIKLPCCDASSTLNDLHYNMPSGFARFLLQAREPKLGRYLPPDKMRRLEVILDTPLKQVWAHYKKQDKSQVRIYRAGTDRGGRGTR
jgi:hypothetical protein